MYASNRSIGSIETVADAIQNRGVMVVAGGDGAINSVFARRRVKAATDGEIVWLRTPLEFRRAPKPLYLIKPV
jgi:hypothetical protein